MTILDKGFKPLTTLDYARLNAQARVNEEIKEAIAHSQATKDLPLMLCLKIMAGEVLTSDEESLYKSAIKKVFKKNEKTFKSAFLKPIKPEKKNHSGLISLSERLAIDCTMEKSARDANLSMTGTICEDKRTECFKKVRLTIKPMVEYREKIAKDDRAGFNPYKKNYGFNALESFSSISKNKPLVYKGLFVS